METSAKFYTVEQFKALINANTIEIKRNPETNKLYMLASGDVYKVQQSIDPAKPIRFMLESDDSDISTGCLVNVTEQETVFSL